MNKLISYECEHCKNTFSTFEQCKLHEENCKVTFICDKCGKNIQYKTNTDEELRNQCHYFGYGRAGYGSKLDGCNIYFDLCDDCLYELIQSFTSDGKDKILNSGFYS